VPPTPEHLQWPCTPPPARVRASRRTSASKFAPPSFPCCARRCGENVPPAPVCGGCVHHDIRGHHRRGLQVQGNQGWGAHGEDTGGYPLTGVHAHARMYVYRMLWVCQLELQLPHTRPHQRPLRSAAWFAIPFGPMRLLISCSKRSALCALNSYGTQAGQSDSGQSRHRTSVGRR
jgi:hypothetical protein